MIDKSTEQETTCGAVLESGSWGLLVCRTLGLSLTLSLSAAEPFSRQPSPGALFANPPPRWLSQHGLQDGEPSRGLCSSPLPCLSGPNTGASFFSTINTRK